MLSSSKDHKMSKSGGSWGKVQWLKRFDCFFREREQLLSKITANPTVGFLRSKKESRSTRCGQRVGTGFLEFRQTP